MNEDQKELSYEEKKEEIKKSLNVDGYGGILDFDDDIFLFDHWKVNNGLNYLLGISFIEPVFEGNERYMQINTLDADFYNEKNQSHIVNAFLNARQRLERIWNSGGHPESNPPSYYIEWAISKGHKIPWLDYAIKKGFYEPNRPKSDLDRPIREIERQTLLIIIAALAKEAKIDITKTSKSAELIEDMTQLLGSPIGATTIETHLKKIPEALESRAK